nr:MAG TPA: hypothetical protein [Caudoviricetes sp.]DAN58702.1 MAG TPA: hypothetical protein [Caudoviricetes sp.]
MNPCFISKHFQTLSLASSLTYQSISSIIIYTLDLSL